MLVYSADHGHTLVDEWWTDDVQIEESIYEQQLEDALEEEEVEDTFSGACWDYWL